MSQQLTDFAAKNRRDIDPFEAAYRAKAEANPEQYPLTPPAGQQGLRYKFYVDQMRVKPLRSRGGRIARSPQANWGLKSGSDVRA